MDRNILVTGGTGFIGSHTVVELLEIGDNVIIVDNLSNSNPSVLEKIEMITGRKPIFYHCDVTDRKALTNVFASHEIHTVIHFAGLKAVAESVAEPLKYYHNNVVGSIILMQVMEQFHVHNLIFSSSATVYGGNNIMPLTEASPTGPVNPYGMTKLAVENICRDLCSSDQNWHIALLRYFNPVGAHVSGLIGEDPLGIPNNLFPIITQVAIGKRDKLFVYGNDYPTQDGTGVRDYIHVVDLALGHIKTLPFVEENPGVHIFNLGTGKGYSVMDVIKAFERVNDLSVPHVISSRRAGDVAECYSNPDKANRILRWNANLGLEDMCRDGWRFQKQITNHKA